MITLSFHRELHKHKPTSSLMRMSYDFSLSVLYRLYPVGAQFSMVFIPGFFLKFPTFDCNVGLASEKYFNIFSQHCHSSDLTWLKKISNFPNDFQFFCREVSDEAVAGGVVDEMVSRTLSHHITTTPLEEEDCDDDGMAMAISSHISHVNPFSSPLWRKSSIQ